MQNDTKFLIKVVALAQSSKMTNHGLLFTDDVTHVRIISCFHKMKKCSKWIFLPSLSLVVSRTEVHGHVRDGNNNNIGLAGYFVRPQLLQQPHGPVYPVRVPFFESTWASQAHHGTRNYCCHIFEWPWTMFVVQWIFRFERENIFRSDKCMH